MRGGVVVPFRFWWPLLLMTAAAIAAAGQCWIETAAAPYTVRRSGHPFDSDWLDVKLMLASKCTGCHRPSGPQCDLTTYEAVADGTGRMDEPLVVPGRPEASLLWRQVAWNVQQVPGSWYPDKPAMPAEHEDEWLTAGQLKTLRRWIEHGALQYRLPESCSPRPLLETDFPSAKQCRACHPKQYREWSRSMHAYAQHSPIFEGFTLTLLERTGGTIGTFCTRCHTPVGVALGENGSRRNVHRSRIAMEGVTCVVCHRIKQPYYKASGRLAVAPGGLLDECLFGPFDDPVSNELGTHPAAGSPSIRSAAFCGACHDVTSPQGIRLEEAFSEWQNSPAAKQGITCQQCHMGPIQGVPIPRDQRPMGRAAQVPGVDPERIPLRPLSDHTFAGPDYSLLPDTEFPHKLDWMYETDYRNVDELTPYQRETLHELRKTNRRQLRVADAKRYELLHNAAKITVHAPETAASGSRVDIRVDVTSLFAGHNFPTGFTAERQAWVEITLVDPLGRFVFRSGQLDSNGDLLDEHSHEVASGERPYDRHLLNFQSKFVTLTNKGTERPVVISVNRHLRPLNIFRPATGISASFGRPLDFRVSKGSLPPLSTAGKTYRIRLPDCPGEYELRVRLNYRHLPPDLFDKIGTPHLKHLLEVVVIDEHESVIEVTPNLGLWATVRRAVNVDDR